MAVVDTDVPSPDSHNLFSLEPDQTHTTLNNYLWSESSIEDTAYDVSANAGIDGPGQPL